MKTEITESCTIRLNVAGGVFDSSEKDLKEKKETTEALQKYAQKNASLICFIEDTIGNYKTKDIQGKRIRFQQLKRKRVIHPKVNLTF